MNKDQPTPDYKPDARKVADDEVALDIAIGGSPVRPYSPSRDLHRGKGDVSGFPAPVEALTADEHQADAERVVAARKADHMKKRGSRRNYQ